MLTHPCIIMTYSIILSALLSFNQQGYTSPFDDLYNSVDSTEDGNRKQAQGSSNIPTGQERKKRAPRCRSSLDQRPLDPIRARLRRKAGDMNSELQNQLTLYFIDAQTGEGVRGAQVTFNGALGRTDRAGRVCFDTPHGSLMDEQHIARFVRQGYATINAELRFMAGALFFNRFSVTKTLPPGRLRVVLDWDASPRDLDAHLVREGTYHISFRKMKAYQDLAHLDRDDLDGFGPETITIQRLDPTASYRFFVRDYTRSAQLAKSKAHVRVYTEEGLIKTFTVPAQVRGDDWPVFELKQGQLR